VLVGRQAFLFVLWRSCGRYLRVAPPFENFDTQAFTGEAAEEDADGHHDDRRGSVVQSPGTSSLNLGLEEKDGDVITDDKELTVQQEQDINAVLANRDWSQNDAEEVIECQHPVVEVAPITTTGHTIAHLPIHYCSTRQG
jgi:hypothetical protein